SLDPESAIHDRIQPRPTLSKAEAARLALDLYSLTGSVTELTSERDQNFHIAVETGEQFVLKIAAAAERKETLEFQNEAMAHLERQSWSVFIPHRRKTKDGDEIAAITRENTSHFVRLLTYHQSPLLSEVSPHPPELLCSLGRFLGEIDL